jgi:hypothetical protein
VADEYDVPGEVMFTKPGGAGGCAGYVFLAVFSSVAALFMLYYLVDSGRLDRSTAGALLSSWAVSWPLLSVLSLFAFRQFRKLYLMKSGLWCDACRATRTVKVTFRETNRLSPEGYHPTATLSTTCRACRDRRERDRLPSNASGPNEPASLTTSRQWAAMLTIGVAAVALAWAFFGGMRALTTLPTVSTVPSPSPQLSILPTITVVPGAKTNNCGNIETHSVIAYGDVSCVEASNIMSEYVRRSPTDGGGNTLFMSLGEWGCLYPHGGLADGLDQGVSAVCQYANNQTREIWLK